MADPYPYLQHTSPSFQRYAVALLNALPAEAAPSPVPVQQARKRPRPAQRPAPSAPRVSATPPSTAEALDAYARQFWAAKRQAAQSTPQKPPVSQTVEQRPQAVMQLPDPTAVYRFRQHCYQAYRQGHAAPQWKE
jgi:hypothetical protein